MYLFKKNVHLLQTDIKARWQGYLFFFKEGFCWTNVLMPTNEDSKFIKCRIKKKSINDVASMSLYNCYNKTNNSYFVSLLNSKFIYNYLKEFINNTVNLQINDFRQIPIIIPNEDEIKEFEKLTTLAVNIKKNQSSNVILNNKLNEIQRKLDELVYKIYNIIQ